MSYFSIHKIKFEGPKSTNQFSFKYYNAEEFVAGKAMKEHLKFAMSYWHTMTGMGNDPFGSATMIRPWDNVDGDLERAKTRVKVAFEFMEKLGMEYFCFHDRDIAPEQETLEETNKVLDEIVDVIEAEMQRTGIKLLWGTTNAFSHPRFVHGASTSCNADVFAYAASQIKKAMDVTKRLGVHGIINKYEVIEYAPYLNWRDYNLKSLLKKHFDTIIHIDNEANLSAIGEKIFSNNFDNMLNVNISNSGIGVGILINGLLYNGFSGFSGEVGHMIVVPNGRKCPCGNNGCWEQYASQKSLIKSIEKVGSSLENYMLSNSLEAIDKINEFYDYLTIGINNLLTTFNPEAIILNSSLFRYLDNPTEEIINRLRSYMNRDFTIRISLLGNKACVLGGISIIIKEFYKVNNIKLDYHK